MKTFKLKSKYKPAGDQPKAIKSLVEGLKRGYSDQTLLGVTGSGKTFTVANVINEFQKPTLVIAHNKTLAAQLVQEYRDFFPDNAVHYFVSYYDYYQPEAYMPVTDTYIEKEATINAEIERLRHASTQALLTRKDVIIVASVSCIYGLGSPEEYEKINFKIEVGKKISRGDFIRKLIGLHYTRTTSDLKSGSFRAIGNKVEIMPVSEKYVLAVTFVGEQIKTLQEIDAITRQITKNSLENYYIFPAKHFVTNEEQIKVAIKAIENEMKERVDFLLKNGKMLEAERIKRRTRYDLAMIREVGYCTGIENYSRYFDGRLPGEPANTLLSYFPHKPDGTADFLTIIDESHVTIPQIGGMYAGDQARKNTLVEHGFRLPSAKDNRPLRFAEFKKQIGQVIYTSATPADYERENSQNIAEQIIRPTGLLDPITEIKPINEQVKNLVEEAKKVIKKKGRVMVTTLTKKMAEDLSEYLKNQNIKAEYLHSEIKTIERIEILSDFRRGKFDVIVGVNLLREGLDLPEVELIGILDADKEGFLRSETSLIQIIGRVARNDAGRVILYADQITNSIKNAVAETRRRRTIQEEYNKKHGITPKTISKNISNIVDQITKDHKKAVSVLYKIDEKLIKNDPAKIIRQKEKQMNNSAKILDFESAAILRDEIDEIKKKYKIKEESFEKKAPKFAEKKGRKRIKI